jgi:cell division protease FtsH
LNENIDILHKLAELLLEKETVLGRELDELIYGLRPGIKLPRHDSEEKEEKAEEGGEEKKTATQPEKEDVDDESTESAAL